MLNPRDLTSYHPDLYFSKLVEKAAVDQLLAYLEEASVLDPYQSGFRPGHGLETTLVALTDDIRRQLDKGHTRNVRSVGRV